MKKQIFLCALVLCLLITWVNAQTLASRTPYKLFNDFETGELFGWEPYPYNQDEGFDPLHVSVSTPTYKNSKYAQARPVKANYTSDLTHGFTKRLNLWTTSDTRVRVAVYFQSDRNAETLELSLGTFDGRRYMHTIKKPEANKWLELDIPAGEFRLNGQSMGAEEHIQVVTIQGTYPMVFYLNTYTILMDDFQINGGRDSRFIATSPKSTEFEMFGISILNKHFFYGDNISLKAAPEGNINLKQVRGSLVDGRGQVVKDNIPFTRSGNEWVNEAIHKFSEKDARGQWEIRLKGVTAQGKETNRAFRFLMPVYSLMGPRFATGNMMLRRKR